MSRRRVYSMILIGAAMIASGCDALTLVDFLSGTLPDELPPTCVTPSETGSIGSESLDSFFGVIGSRSQARAGQTSIGGGVRRPGRECGVKNHETRKHER